MIQRGADKAGLAKVIPPPEWNHRVQYNDAIEQMVMKNPIIQEFTQLSNGIFQASNSRYEAKMKVYDLKKLSETKKYATPILENDDSYETAYWQNLNSLKPIYGTDVAGSLTHASVTER